MTASSSDKSNSVVPSAKRLVVKVGSSLVTNEGRGIDIEAVERWAEQIARLHAQGREVVLVSSGAIAEGMARLDRKSTRLNSSHVAISYAVFCLKKKTIKP